MTRPRSIWRDSDRSVQAKYAPLPASTNEVEAVRGSEATEDSE